MAFIPERYLDVFGPWLLVRFEGDPTPRVYCPYISRT